MTEVTTHDIIVGDTTYILEWYHGELGERGHIAITEACDDPEAAELGECDSHEAYDFEEVI